MTVATCAQCKQLSHDARVYMVHEEGGASGGITWMCPPCLTERKGVPAEMAEAVAYVVAADAIRQAVSDGTDAASSQERACWAAYVTHCSECRGCRGRTTDGCPQADTLHDAWKAAQRAEWATTRPGRCGW